MAGPTQPTTGEDINFRAMLHKTTAGFTIPYGSTFSSTRSDVLENIRSFTGTFQMAVRAFGNHQTTRPISSAKTGAVMSPLHEGSVNGMS